LYLNY
jgi:hypothetical protein